ncbi:MAG: CsbD family protein [Ilumatobacteraceae bacterium]
MDNDLDQAKGRIKQAAGDLTDNDDLKRQGKADEAGGKAKEFLDDAKDKAEDAIDAVKDKFDGNKNT